MPLIKKNNYYLYEVKTQKHFLKLIDFLNSSSGNFSIIINLLDWRDYTVDVCKLLLPFHFSWQKTNKSFILVSSMKKKDSKELVSINSLEEALDYFHMEELTKNI